MGQYVVWPAAVGQHDLLEELFQIACVVEEALHVAALAVADQPVGATLAAPVQGSDAETPVGQVADGLEVFLDALVAARQEDDGALHRTSNGRKKTVADLLAVARGEKAAGRVFRCRIARNFVEEVRHSALRLWCRCPASGARLGMVIDANAAKAKGFHLNGKSRTAKRRVRPEAPPAACFRPLSIREKGRYTRLGLVAALYPARLLLDLEDTLAP